MAPSVRLATIAFANNSAQQATTPPPHPIMPNSTGKRSIFGFKFKLFMALEIHQAPAISYQLPKKEIVELIDIPFTPSILPNRQGTYFAQIDKPSLPNIDALAQAVEKLAGLSINSTNNTASRHFYFRGISIGKLNSNTSKSELKRLKGLSKKAQILHPKWSPDGKKLAFCCFTKKKCSLWIADVKSLEAKQVSELSINAIIGSPVFEWMPNSKKLLVRAINEMRGTKPKAPLVPKGPIIKENLGGKAPNRTYQNLLKTPYDASLLKYYCSSQVHLIDLEGGSKKIGKPGIIFYFLPSPDGKNILLETVHEPFSYLVPWQRFPLKSEVWNLKNKLVAEVADLELAEDVPMAFGSVRRGARSIHWRNDVPATLYWTEAQDEGDAAKEAKYRDRLYYWEAPFEGKPSPSINLELRLNNIKWGNGEIAIVEQSWWQTRRKLIASFPPDRPKTKPKLIFDLSWEDQYASPGSFKTTLNKAGKSVLQFDSTGKGLYLFGAGASPEGKRPFVDNFTIRGSKIERLWRSKAPYFSSPVRWMDKEQTKLLISRESKTEPVNYHILNLTNENLEQLTSFPNLLEDISKVKTAKLYYKREDGIELNGTLRLPPNYEMKKDGPIPCIIWAYPQEFKNSKTAGQVKDSPYRFNRIDPWSTLFFCLMGYAVLDDPSMPIIGEKNEEPNDTYIEQLVSNAEAAIDALVDYGVGDRKRIAIGGHSYGAFMTANLLAHSELFAAGIARSGAYNRSLTPFGFQAEQRSLWEAPEVYQAMSPFNFAHKLKTPLLMIHGEDDSNSGTYPLQSERFYNALKGQGATTRLVMLPKEGHGYIARESILHMLWEMNEWLDKYL